MAPENIPNDMCYMSYDDMVSAMRKLIQDGKIRLEDASLVIPRKELVESEDERIRKEIIAFLRSYHHASHDGYVKMQKWIKWLEKHHDIPMWRKIKKGELLPCESYIWKFAYEDKKNFCGKCYVEGHLVPNVACRIECDTWYLPVDEIKNLPKEE